MDDEEHHHHHSDDQANDGRKPVKDDVAAEEHVAGEDACDDGALLHEGDTPIVASDDGKMRGFSTSSITRS